MFASVSECSLLVYISKQSYIFYQVIHTESLRRARLGLPFFLFSASRQSGRRVVSAYLEESLFAGGRAQHGAAEATVIQVLVVLRRANKKGDKHHALGSS